MNIRNIHIRGKGILLFLLLMICAAYIAGLFVDVTRDGSKYASVAREIYENGNFLNPTIHGDPYYQKPPFLFWISALSFKLFGVSNFAFKLPVLLLSILGLYLVYKLGETLYNRPAGRIAAVLLGTSQIYFLYNMDIHTDTVLQVFVTLSLYFFYRYLSTDRFIFLLAGFLGIGLAMLTKGPVGAVVPAFAVFGYLVSGREWRRIADPRWFIGILLTLLFLMPYLVSLYHRFGKEGIEFYFWTNNIGRLKGDYTSADREPLFYLYNLLLFFAPWMLMAFVSFFYGFRALAHGKFKPQDGFVFSGIWFFFLIISLSKGKLPNYMFVVMPLISVLTAKYVFIALHAKGKRLLKIFLPLQSMVAFLTGLLLIALVTWFFPLKYFWQWIFLLGSAGAALYPCLCKSQAWMKLLIPSLALMGGFNFFLNQHAASLIFADQASVKAAKIFNSRAEKEEGLYNYNYVSHELFFYGKTPVKQLVNDLQLFELMKRPGNWVLTTGEVVRRMPPDEFPPPEIIPLKHVWINKLTFGYLNPGTRDQNYDTLYLLHSQSGGKP